MQLRMPSVSDFFSTHSVLHFAVAGSTGTGKSSLINAFRRLRDTDEGAAKVDIAEATLETQRYPDPDPELPRRRFVWYDIPGAGGAKIDDWEYFKKQQLFVFDLVLVVVAGRFRKSDLVLLQHCERLDVPTFLVRSKSDQEIQSIQKQLEAADENEDEDEDDDKSDGSCSPVDYYQAARNQYISTARENVRTALANAGLPDKPVYLVTNEGLLLVSKYMGQTGMAKLKGVKNKQRYEQLLDEETLMRNLLLEAYSRRYSNNAPMSTNAPAINVLTGLNSLAAAAGIGSR